MTTNLADTMQTVKPAQYDIFLVFPYKDWCALQIKLLCFSISRHAPVEIQKEEILFFGTRITLSYNKAGLFLSEFIYWN